MATGDENDVLARLNALLPPWFDGSGNPVLEGALSAFAESDSFNYSQFDYVDLQMRVITATDSNLDAIAVDYFGVNGYPRGNGESDASYRRRILANLIQERATQRGMQSMLFVLTNIQPIIFEPQRAADSGGYSVGGCGYDVFGRWSNPNCAYQCFIIVFNPVIAAISGVAGYNVPTGAYNTPSRAAYCGVNSFSYLITQDQILDQINKTKCEGTVVWVRFL